MQIQSGLNYCSRCGRRVAEDQKSGDVFSNPTAIAGMVAGIGFIAYIIVLRILTRSEVVPNVYVPLTFFYFSALFGLCVMFLRQGRPYEASKKAKPPEPAADEPAYLRPVTTAQLEEGREFGIGIGIGSVTDSTTRTLDKVPLREKQK